MSTNPLSLLDDPAFADAHALRERLIERLAAARVAKSEADAALATLAAVADDPTSAVAGGWAPDTLHDSVEEARRRAFCRGAAVATLERDLRAAEIEVSDRGRAAEAFVAKRASARRDAIVAKARAARAALEAAQAEEIALHNELADAIRPSAGGHRTSVFYLGPVAA